MTFHTCQCVVFHGIFYMGLKSHASLSFRFQSPCILLKHIQQKKLISKQHRIRTCLQGIRTCTSKYYLRGRILIDIPGFPYENHLWQHYQGYTFLSKSGKLQTVFLNFLYTHLQSLEQTIAKILQKLKNVFHSPSFQPTCKIPLKNICRHALFLKIAKLLYKNRLMKKTCTRFKLFLYSFE